MSERLDSWDKVAAFALTLPGTELGTSYRMPTVKVAANGRGFVWTGHEAETSFAMWVEDGETEMLLETDPGTFWQSPHYAGSRGPDPLCERGSRARALHDRAGL